MFAVKKSICARLTRLTMLLLLLLACFTSPCRAQTQYYLYEMWFMIVIILEEREIFGFRNRLVKLVGAHLFSVLVNRAGGMHLCCCNARTGPTCKFGATRFSNNSVLCFVFVIKLVLNFLFVTVLVPFCLRD